jgi:thiol-disulfide isomerase/thioredoxin
MKRISLLAVVFFVCSAAVAQVKTMTGTPAGQTGLPGYNIAVTVTPLKNDKLYLGCYYGKYKSLVDSIILDDKSSGVFKGAEKLHPGIYFLVSSQRVLLFEFLMDDAQHFSIKADSTNYNQAVITGSKENALFTDYNAFLGREVPKITELQSKLKITKLHRDSLPIEDSLKKLNQIITDYRQNVIANHPQSMLAWIFTVIKRPEPPESMSREEAGYYMKDHYWDGVLFNDPRLLRTPFFDPKLQDYFKYFVSAEPDSIIPEVNYMLLSARTNPDMFQYLLGNFTDKYINPEIMGQDKVFLFLFNNFYSKGDTAWLTKEHRKYIFDRAYSLIANQIGSAAPALDLVDSSGKTESLYAVKSPFTVVVFWDPDCVHCQKELPVLDSIYRAKWKAEGVKIYAVNVAEDKMDHWKKYIADHHIGDWIQVYQLKSQREEEAASQQANYRQLYDVSQTPTVYLLDKDKHIIAKKLTIDQLDDVITAKIKTQKTTSKE